METGYCIEDTAIVSILVLMDWGLQLNASDMPFQVLTGFNPCFDGLGTSTIFRAYSDLQECEFQSLFWWIGDFNRGTLHRQGFPRSVSILVLMDWGLQLSQIQCFIILQNSFNPCFDGLGTSTSAIARQAVGADKFQSLFWWIGDFNRAKQDDSDCENDVSILVLMDWGLQRSNGRRKIFRRSLFQSLFWWIGDFNQDDSNQEEFDLNVSILVLMDWGLQRFWLRYL